MRGWPRRRPLRPGRRSPRRLPRAQAQQLRLGSAEQPLLTQRRVLSANLLCFRAGRSTTLSAAAGVVQEDEVVDIRLHCLSSLNELDVHAFSQGIGPVPPTQAAQAMRGVTAEEVGAAAREGEVGEAQVSPVVGKL